MPQTIVCSICSREKKQDTNPLPARERYIGSHIKIADEAAAKDNLPLYILSGLHGLLPATQLVLSYNYLLEKEGIPKLVSTLCRQITGHRITEIRFYTKTKPAWQPYLDALQLAAEKEKITLQTVELPDDA